MKVIINFGEKKVVVPCGTDGDISIRELIHFATAKYCKLSYSNGSILHSDQVQLRLHNGAVVDPDDRVGDVIDDCEELFALIDFHQTTYPSHTTMNSNGELSSSLTSSNLSSSLSEHDRATMPSSNHRHEVLVTDADLRTRSLRVKNDPTCHSQPSLSQQSSSFNSKMTHHRQRHSPPTQDATRISTSDDVRGMYDISLDDKTGDQLFTVLLPKENIPLGIHVVPSNADEQQVHGLVLQNIEADGRIKRQGILQINDRIIEINRTNIERCSFDKAQLVFRTALLESELELRIHRRTKTLSKSMSFRSTSAENDQSFVANDSYMNSLNTRRLGKKIHISLIKGHDGLGFKLASRDNPTGAANPIYVKTIFPKGAAVEDGRLQRGDRLLTVNSLDVTQLSLPETVALLRETRVGETVEFCISRQHDGFVSQDPRTDEIQITDEPFVEMKGQKMTFDIALNDTSSAGLGITLKGKTSIVDGQSVDLGIFVKSILTGGAASRDNRLRPNDQLLVINDSSLINTSNLEAATILHEAVRREIHPGYIKVTISRLPISTDDHQTNSTKFVREIDLSPSLMTNDENELDLTTFVPPPARKPPAQQSTRHSARRADSETRPVTQQSTSKTSDEVDSSDVNPFDRETPFRQSVSEKRRLTHQPNKQAVQWKQRSFHERKQPPRLPPSNSSSTASTYQPGLVRSSSFESIRLNFEEPQSVNVKPVNEDERKRQAKLRSRACNDSFRQAVDKSYCQNVHMNDGEIINEEKSNKLEKQRFRFASLFTTKSKRKEPQDEKTTRTLIIQHQSPPQDHRQSSYPPPPAAFSSRQNSSSSASSTSTKKPPKIQNNDRPSTVFPYSSTEQQGYQPYRFNSNQTQFHIQQPSTDHFTPIRYESEIVQDNPSRNFSGTSSLSINHQKPTHSAIPRQFFHTNLSGSQSLKYHPPSSHQSILPAYPSTFTVQPAHFTSYSHNMDVPLNTSQQTRRTGYTGAPVYPTSRRYFQLESPANV